MSQFKVKTQNTKSIVILMIGIITVCITSFLLGMSYERTLVHESEITNRVKSITAEEFIKDVFKENRN